VEAIAEIAPELLDTYQALAERTRALADRDAPTAEPRRRATEPEVAA
jgi:hypothetical protein